MSYFRFCIPYSNLDKGGTVQRNYKSKLYSNKEDEYANLARKDRIENGMKGNTKFMYLSVTTTANELTVIVGNGNR